MRRRKPLVATNVLLAWFVILLLLLQSSLYLPLGVDAATAQSFSSTSGTHASTRRYLQKGDNDICFTVHEVESINRIEGFGGGSVFLSANGQVLVTGDPAVVLVYDAETKTWRTRASDSLNEPYPVVGEAHAMTADGNFLAASFNATTDSNPDAGIEVRWVQYSGEQTNLWNFVGGPFVLTNGFIREMVFSANLEVLAVSSSNNIVQVFEWKVSSRAWIQLGDDILGSWAVLENLVMSDDGSLVACFAGAVGETTAVHVYEFDPQAHNWAQLGQKITGGIDFGHDVAVSGDGRFVVISEANYGVDPGPGLVQVYQISEDRTLWEPRGPAVEGNSGSNDNAGSSVDISEDGSVLAVGANGNTGRVRIYTFDNESDVWQLQETLQVQLSGGRSRFGSSVSLTPDGSFLATNTIFYGALVQVFAMTYGCPTAAPASAQLSPSASPLAPPSLAAIGVGVALVITTAGFILWRLNRRTTQNNKRLQNIEAPSATNATDTAAESGGHHQPPVSVVATPVEFSWQFWSTRNRPRSSSGNYPPNSTSMGNYPQAQVHPLADPLPNFKDQCRNVARQEGELPIATSTPDFKDQCRNVARQEGGELPIATKIPA